MERAKLRFEVKVKPGSVNSKIVSRSPWVVELKSQPDKGKANLELVKLLKKELGKQVKIVSGLTSREKVVEVLE